MRIFKTISEAYLGALQDVYETPEYVSAPRGQRCREKLDYTFRVLEPDSDPIVTRDEERNRTIASYTSKEVELYNSCTNSAADFGRASKFWLGLANPDGTVNSAYGHLIWAKKSHGSNFEHEQYAISEPKDGMGGLYGHRTKLRTPWEWAKESLINDKDTRQAILRFSLPEHHWFGVRDFVCTLHGNFLIRDNKLHFSIVMRSNDLMLGLVYDLPWFCSLIDKMIEELKPIYPNLTKGHYTHTVHSLHIYERDEEKVKKMLGL
jgi:thymidylate synthase